ncbi:MULTISPECIES: hypothetical protein [Cyanophyceae]|uniref:Uncharacterized protein n=1 Tax=Leptolyngbya subtilissima DQ-A4 TaxID=2933933 RepID=A0ABV0JZH7_9CYAN|nr:hypothetical protein [Nodosilinea sp. FACHB-141]MBD2112538.1 hypothetical protein [Nodosilinea sp. FACHB-141]
MADGDLEPCCAADGGSHLLGRAPRRSPQVREGWFYWIEPMEGKFGLFLRDREGCLYWCDLTFESWIAAEAALRGVLWRNAGGLFCNPSDWLAFTELQEP